VDATGSSTDVNSLSLGGNVTNQGILELDASESDVIMNGPSNTLTNDGTFETEGIGNSFIRTNVTNNGSVVIDANTAEDSSGGTTMFTNDAALSVGDGDGLSISGGSSFDQSSTATFSPTIDAATGASGIVGGVDTLDGALDPATVGSPTVGSTYEVLSGATSVTGTFSTIVGTYAATYSVAGVTVKFT
jgi:hypothetical protein